jgi:hypothetical protein
MIRFARAAVLFTLLTVVMTWPQTAHLTTDAWDHYDVFFNMWRLGSFAHALAKSPAHLLDGNIFYPESRTLTYSDAMVVEAVVAAPLLWMGVSPVLVHNLMLLGGIVVSAAGIFMLAATLTGESNGGRNRRYCVRVRALPLRPLHASGAAVDGVDSMGVLGSAPSVRDRRAP